VGSKEENLLKIKGSRIPGKKFILDLMGTSRVFQGNPVPSKWGGTPWKEIKLQILVAASYARDIGVTEQRSFVPLLCIF